MNKQVSKIVAGAVLLALGAGSVHAGDKTEPRKKSPSKEVTTGMVSGTVVGALIGGPFGAGLGFILGSTAGAGVEKAKASKQYKLELEQKLASAEQQLFDAQAALAATSQKSGDPMFAELAQRLRADILFRTKSAELDAQSSANLAKLGATLAQYPGLIIEIDGYADPRGKSGENLELSQQRASAVRAALMIGGAPSEAIKIAAHGEQMSTATQGDLEAYAWERRVSFSVLPAPEVKGETQVAKTE